MGTPLQVERPFPSLSPYSLNDTHISTTQQTSTPTFHYDSINDQRLYASEHIPSHMPPFSSYANTSRVRTSADTSTSKQSNGMGMINTGLGSDDNMSGGSGTMKRTNKTHVPSACVNCKRAHLACDGKFSFFFLFLLFTFFFFKKKKILLLHINDN
ncbi:hypothetical protein C1645_545478 [Glomus cerebriforme]|uniref:Zn(2)-C6 fungal-type domain-containing protein n=1 Tax=Glomus cerebriforme TaxID=658196 RepID=A0A397S5L7_9GLOM|nr:hypothetical protein C1645_545478 [Glomus cerebriforme]